jgi:hypothetical protein
MLRDGFFCFELPPLHKPVYSLPRSIGLEVRHEIVMLQVK